MEILHNFILSNNSEFQTFDTSTNIDIKTIVGGSTFFHANLNGCMFTKRSGQIQYLHRLMTIDWSQVLQI